MSDDDKLVYRRKDRDSQSPSQGASWFPSPREVLIPRTTKRSAPSLENLSTWVATHYSTAKRKRSKRNESKERKKQSSIASPGRSS
ncbi:hypothetical protein ABKN59_007935 [Abortiporus biennis]